MAGFLAALGGALGGLSSLIGLGQSGFNLFKDFNNVDMQRQADLQKTLMNEQYDLNSELAYQQYGYSQNLAKLQNELQQVLMDKSQGFNSVNMKKQFLYNLMLSNRGRDIYALRMGGLNPAAMNGSTQGSVSLPSSPQGQSNVPIPGLPSVGFGSVSPTSYSPSSSAANSALDIAQIQKLAADTKGQNIRNLFGLIRERTTILKERSESYSAFMSGAKSEQEIRIRREEWDKYLRPKWEKDLHKIDSEIEYYSKTAKANERTSQANEKNAETAANRNEWQKRVADAQLIINDFNAKTARQGVKIEGDKLEALKPVWEAQKRHENALANLTDQDIIWYADKIASVIDVNEALAKKSLEDARLTGEKADAFIYDLIMQHVEVIADKVLDFYTKGLSREAEQQSRANSDRIKEEAAKRVKHKYEENGVTPQGRKTKRTTEWETTQ